MDLKSFSFFCFTWCTIGSGFFPPCTWLVGMGSQAELWGALGHGQGCHGSGWFRRVPAGSGHACAKNWFCKHFGFQVLPDGSRWFPMVPALGFALQREVPAPDSTRFPERSCQHEFRAWLSTAKPLRNPTKNYFLATCQEGSRFSQL